MSDLGAQVHLRTACTDTFVEWAYQWCQNSSVFVSETRRSVRILAAQIVMGYGMVFNRAPWADEWARDFITCVTEKIRTPEALQTFLHGKSIAREYRRDLLRGWGFRLKLAGGRRSVAVQRFAIEVGTVFLSGLVRPPESILDDKTDWSRMNCIAKGFALAKTEFKPFRSLQDLWLDFQKMIGVYK